MDPVQDRMSAGIAVKNQTSGQALLHPTVTKVSKLTKSAVVSGRALALGPAALRRSPYRCHKLG